MVWSSTVQDPSTDSWAFHKYEGSEEYSILKIRTDSEYPFVIQQLETGEKFEMKLKENRHLNLDT